MNNINEIFRPKIKGKSVLITGATGLIGKALVYSLLDLSAKVTVVVRSREKAERIWGTNVDYIETDVTRLPLINLSIDYIVHAAANTSSKAFSEEPVDIIRTNVLGTIQLLEFAKKNPVRGFVYLSSMEIYGAPDSDEKIDEDHAANINTMARRSSYPESKRICECLCASYAAQFHIPTKVIRLAQTFGSGVLYDDGRVFAEFARCVIENRNIVLHTKGDTKRSYLYLEDAVSAIFFVLMEGEVGEAYNAANENTYCSIADMANMVVEHCAKGNIKVEVMPSDRNVFGYAPTLRMNLSTQKLRNLGWSATTGLREMFDLLISDMKHTKNSR